MVRRPFARFGRKPGFWLGCLGSLCGSLTYAAGIYEGNFALYCAGAVPAGLGWGIAQHLRFAAAEVATTEARPRAIALVTAPPVMSLTSASPEPAIEPALTTTSAEPLLATPSVPLINPPAALVRVPPPDKYTPAELPAMIAPAL